MCTRGCLLRTKCTGDIFSNQINKGDLPLRYKFLLHVRIQCISNRRARYDMAGNDLVGFMVALVLNKPFSISKYIFSNMKENMMMTGSRITGNKLWMYPRFLQMIMNAQHPNLPKADNDILKIEPMILNSLKIIKSLAAKRYEESDPPRKLIGALGKPDYIAPADDKWRHDDSQSDNEEPELKRKMIEKFGPDPVDSESLESDSEDDGGDTGAVGASSAGAAGGTSAGDDEEDSDLDDHLIEPGYEMYLDERGVKRFRKIRQEDDPEYVTSDTEAERLKKKESDVHQKKKARRYLATSVSVPQEPIQETLVVSSAPETPTVTPQAAPQRSMASASRATTSQPSSERQRVFSEMSQDEKNNFLFSQLEAAADRIQRQTDFIRITKNDQLSQQVEINTLKSTVEQQQTVIGCQQAEIDQLKAENVRLKAADEEREREKQLYTSKVSQGS
ncbi:hypothetical protein HanXRQr2_Chr11g0514121 [Helianthus annuus]|uniref:Uncharacterized protein n=1 Tax=Helianthus annuus TaxID=4232 RepID=A0A9K3HSH1_HELAN|nr:hypothetical protein HanXRQr2_Chr11g0514121 [Helianthus annuus]KAJ0519178.1 hypothetical protein HanHA89_Chr11g0445861 [Helianthus annuus]